MIRNFKNFIVKENMFNDEESIMLKHDGYKKLAKLFAKYGYDCKEAINKSYGTRIYLEPNNPDMPKIFYDEKENKSLNGFRIVPVSYFVNSKTELDNYIKYVENIKNLMNELMKWDFKKMLPTV